jgi:hypothetical protein
MENVPRMAEEVYHDSIDLQYFFYVFSAVNLKMQFQLLGTTRSNKSV